MFGIFERKRVQVCGGAKVTLSWLYDVIVAKRLNTWIAMSLCYST